MFFSTNFIHRQIAIYAEKSLLQIICLQFDCVRGGPGYARPKDRPGKVKHLFLRGSN